MIGSGIQRSGRNCASRRCTIIIGRSAFSLPLKGEAAHVRMAKTVPDPSQPIRLGDLRWAPSDGLSASCSQAVCSGLLQCFLKCFPSGFDKTERCGPAFNAHSCKRATNSLPGNRQDHRHKKHSREKTPVAKIAKVVGQWQFILGWGLRQTLLANGRSS